MHLIVAVINVRAQETDWPVLPSSLPPLSLVSSSALSRPPFCRGLFHVPAAVASAELHLLLPLESLPTSH